MMKLAPEAGLEPATRRLIPSCPAIDLLRNFDPWFRPIRLFPIRTDLPWDPTEGRNLLESLCHVKRICGQVGEIRVSAGIEDNKRCCAQPVHSVESLSHK